MARPSEQSVSDASRIEKPALRFAFGAYKTLISPVIHAISPSRCLYLPTCSEYAYTALSRFGIVCGSWLALRRFARCHPWGKGGLDPVPLQAGSANGQNRPDHLP
jgi:putative membrane protein insertion efficiency factor